ncbi:mannitol dehydrogenase family protein [Xylanimonas oleitrophica]|uniref:mannitol dehydrogenase family protein n=1 Tax=Xylanimonas oleitrophica TaxID=2607479 RepID=UPI001FE2C4C5|nr:mannitol dehydrogenase family protein [Xylanimonas oleitrophica]
MNSHVRPLNRSTHPGDGRGPAPARIVHLGLGAFHRAHQAWYTDVVDAAGEWGIAAFTGRSPAAAEELGPQDGLFTLVERGGGGDGVRVVRSIVEAWDGARVDRLVALLAHPETAVVTLTITEAGYRLAADGGPDLTDPAVAADVALLRALPDGDLAAHAPAAVTALGRLVVGLEARRRAGGAPIAVVPCDNLASNGRLVRAVLLRLAAEVGPETEAWFASDVSCVSTSVDRITPRTTDADRELVRQSTGFDDAAPVITEPFTDWVLSGDFPAGRPAWEQAGARFVADVEPFERRKLWLLNGAHTLLALLGPARGHTTVAQAIGDPALRAAVERLWDEAQRHLPAEGLDLPAYRAALVERFENSRIEHLLEQILLDTDKKLVYRIVPVAVAERAAGRDASACAVPVAAWVERQGEPAVDVLERLDPALAQDEQFVALVESLVGAPVA